MPEQQRPGEDEIIEPDAGGAGDPDPGAESGAETPGREPAADDGEAPRRAIVDEASGTIGWRELVRDFVKPGRAQVVFAAILLVLGLGVAMQVRTLASETDYSTLRHAELVQMLDDLTAESRRLEAEIADLEATRTRLQSGVDSERVAREEAQRRLDVLAILGGTAPAQGQGVRITISDPQQKVTAELLLNTVEEMRDAGAEVIAINGTVRVVASTWFSSEAQGLLVDGHRISRPITIEVIGDPHALTEAARFTGGLVSEVEGDRIGGTVGIVTDDKVTITAVVSPPDNRYAKPA